MKIVYLLLVLNLLLFAQAPAGTAEMKINEVLYKQVTSGSDNEEFIEFYVTQSGNIENYVFSDQDSKSNHEYIFPSQQVTQGEYVVLHIGNGVDGQSGNVYHFYMGHTEILNNVGDDINLLKPDTNDTTTLADGGGTFNAIPFDYVAFDDGDAVDAPPVSSNGVTVSWDSSENNRLRGADSGQSISLTPNAQDSDSSLCWERTAIDDATKKASNCPNYVATKDTNSDASFVESSGESNTASANLTLTKSSCVIEDPINGTNNPKRTTGATIRYALEVQNSGEVEANEVKVEDNLANEFDSSTIENLQIQSGACDCLGVSSASNNGANGTANGVNPVVLDFGDVGAGTVANPTTECGYFEVKLI